MSQKSHRLIGVIRIEPPVMEISGGEEDDSTIGGLLARFAQRSLLAAGSRQAWWHRAAARWNSLQTPATQPTVHANLGRLMKDLDDEFAILSDLVA